MPTPRRRKVAHLTSVHPPFDSRIFHKEARTLAGAGYDVVVIAAHGGRSEVVAGVRVRAVPPPGGSRRRRMTATARAVWRAALEEDADLYHFHDPELIPVGVGLKLAGKRVVYDVHEDVPRQIMAKHWIHPLLRRGAGAGAALAEALGARLFDGIVAASPVIAERFARSGKAELVRNFPMPEEFAAAAPRPYPGRPPDVAYVGGIRAVRGIREVVRAVDLLPDGPNATRLILAGAFVEPGLEAECRALPGWGRVDFLGWQSRAGVAALLGRVRAGLVVHHPVPNHLEGYPVKMFEYMAAGLPVIASDIPLLRRIIEEAGCGLVVDAYDPAATAEAIGWVLAHPDEAEAMGRRGRAAVAAACNWTSEAAKLLALYARLLAREPSSPTAAAAAATAGSSGSAA